MLRIDLLGNLVAVDQLWHKTKCLVLLYILYTVLSSDWEESWVEYTHCQLCFNTLVLSSHTWIS